MKKELNEAKIALDELIRKSRVHLYKPIQIAEILYKHRMEKNINLLDLEGYRSNSKKWRDDISILLLGRKCTSSAKFQDSLFDENAIPPRFLKILGDENVRTGGAVEAYIYSKFVKRHTQLSNALDYCLSATPETFKVKQLIDSFWNEPGLRRSLDKIYEIIVYALFSTLVDVMDLKVELSITEKSFPLLDEFEDFSLKIMCLDHKNTTYVQDASIYRVGVTNAADRGLNMYSNRGPAIQIKHLSLGVELADDIISNVSSDKIVIVCKDAERDVIMSLLSQIGWKKHIQSIVTEDALVEWYEKALRGKYSEMLASKLLESLVEEVYLEFPSLDTTPSVLAGRRYDEIKSNDWV